MSFNACTAVVPYNRPQTTAEFIKTEAEKFQMKHFGVKFKDVDWTFAGMQKLAQMPQAPSESPSCWVLMPNEVIPSLRDRVSAQTEQLSYSRIPTPNEGWYIVAGGFSSGNPWTFTRCAEDLTTKSLGKN